MSTDSQLAGLGAQAPRNPRLKLDLTVNVPTLITLFSMSVAAVVAGVKLYADLDARTTRAAYEIETLRGRVANAEGAVAALRAETGATAQALRAEIKQELTEIKNTLNDLAFGRRGAPQLREWSR